MKEWIKPEVTKLDVGLTQNRTQNPSTTPKSQHKPGCPCKHCRGLGS